MKRSDRSASSRPRAAIIFDEAGQAFWRPRPSAQPWRPAALAAEERVLLAEQIDDLRILAHQVPMDLPAHWELGRCCLAAEQTGYWARVSEFEEHARFASCVVFITGEGSRQTYDRRMLLAGAFSAETIQRCHKSGVGFQVLAAIASVDWRWRPILVELACEKAPLRALVHLRTIGEAHEPTREDMAEVLREAYQAWKTNAAQPATEKSAERSELEDEVVALRRWRAAQESREAQLAAREAQLAAREAQLRKMEDNVRFSERSAVQHP